MSPKRYTARINYSVTADLALKAASPRKRQQPRSDESSGAKGARRGRRGENAAARRCNTVAFELALSFSRSASASCREWVWIGADHRLCGATCHARY